MKHAILVEDDPVNATLFRRLLERRGAFRVTVTESAEEVLRLAHSGDIALVVMDVSLRNSDWHGQPVSGVEICKMLKSEPATAAIPVILATAHAMRGDEEELLRESGADAYASKPVLDHEAFMKQVMRCIRPEAA